MKIETTDNQLTVPAVLVILASLTLLIFSTHAESHIIDNGDGTYAWDEGGINISFSGVADESCRLVFGNPCPLSDVGKATYNANTDYLTLDQLTLLITEPDLFTVLPVTNKNSEVWVKCDPTNPDHFCSPFAPTKPTFNLTTGASNKAIGGSSFQTSIKNEGAISAVPVPASIWLFVSGLLGLVSVGRRR